MNETLTFSCLDGIALAAQRNRLNEFPSDYSVSVDPLGPFVELMLLSLSGIIPQLHQIPWLRLEDTYDLYSALRSNRKHGVNRNHSLGFFRTSDQWNANDIDWIRFCLSAQKAATAANFPRPLPAQLAAALEELTNNIYEHSSAADSGIAIFRAGREQFELAVVDRGIGTLASLQSCTEYSHLTDHGQALRLALSEGVSRFGQSAKRGNGFRPIFVGLANLNGSLRFRSGDHAFSIDGQQISVPAKLAQKVFLRGFLASLSFNLQK